MGFFAGKYTDGKTVLSLNTLSGGDTNAHYSPTVNSIFHSDMPHVIVNEVLSVNLADGGNNYRYATMPSKIANYLNNDSNRVILTEVVFSNGQRMMMSGTSMGVGAKAYGFIGSQWPSGAPGWSTAAGGGKTNITVSGDSTLDVGYFFAGTSGTIPEKLRDGTGAQHIIGCFSGKTDRGMGPPVGPIIPPDTRGIFIGGTSIYRSVNGGNVAPNPLYASNTLTIPSNSFRHPGARGFGFDSIYVRGYTPVRNVYGVNGSNFNESGVVHGGANSGNIIVTDAGSSDSIEYSSAFVRANPRAYIYWDNQNDSNDAASGPIGLYEDSLGVVPASVNWYVTNLKYTGSGFSVENNYFTGSDIIISPSNFTIKGVNLMNTSWKFINSVGIGDSVGNRPDMRNIGCNVSTTNATPSSGASSVFGLSVANSNNSGGVQGGNVTGLKANLLSIYNFQSSSDWYVDSRTNTIGNQWGEVWGPNSVPLRLLNGSASANISGNIKFTTGSNIQLATMALGINSARNGAIVCTLDFTDDNWISAAGIGCYNPVEINNQGANTGDSRTRIGGNTVAKKLHQVLSLPPNEYVPFYSVKGNVVNASETRSGYYQPTPLWVNSLPGGNAQSGNYTITYYLRNDGNGNVSVWVNCSLNNITGMKVGLPSMRVTIQRLT